MPKPFKPTRPFRLPTGAEVVTHNGKPHVRLKERGKAALYPLTKDGTKYLRPAKRYYFDLRDEDGTVRRVKGYTDLKATEQLAAELERKTSRTRAGMIDPAEEHARRSLADHLKDYAAYLEAKGDTAEHVGKTVSLVTTAFTGAGFVFPRDVDAAKVAEWLNAIRRDGRPVELPDGVEGFTPKAAAALLGVTTSAVGKSLRRRGLTATGNGKARRIPRAAVETLARAAARGTGPEQCNHYVRAAKGFTRWLTRTRRIGVNPLETLTLLNTATDVRHGRRELTAHELRSLLAGTLASKRTFRGLTGADRHALYLTAAGTGFRANALANLTPADFGLDDTDPTVTLAARFNKSKRVKVQPVPADVSAVLRDYLVGKPLAAPVWPGTWREKAADMLRADLEAVNIAYAVERPDGPEYADFHALRHSYLTLGGRAGIDMRTLQELAGHSTPLLTARYMHVRSRDAAGAVGKLPSLVTNSDAPTTKNARRPTSPLPRAGAVQDAVTGCAGTPQSASDGTSGPARAESGGTSETLEKEGAGADSHRPASIGSEWAVPGLNRGPSDFQSLALPTELTARHPSLYRPAGGRQPAGGARCP